MILKTLSGDEENLARSAVTKLAQGEALTEREARAHRKAEAIQETSWRRRIYRSVPQKDFGAMCGGNGRPKPTKQLQDMERLWSLPFAGETVDLYEFLSTLWQRLIEYGPLLRVLHEEGDDAEGTLGVQYLKAKIEKTREEVRDKSLKNEQQEGRLCDRQMMHSALERLAARINRASERAQTKWGPDGFEFFADLAQGFKHDLMELFDAGSRGAAAEDEVADDEGADPDSEGAANVARRSVVPQRKHRTKKAQGNSRVRRGRDRAA